MLTLLLFCLAQATPALSGTAHTQPVPAGLAAPIAAALAPAGVKANVNGTALTFWWVRALPLTADRNSPGWGDVPEGSLVGVVSMDHDFRDIRGRVIRTGTYTLRYGIQPANGDHLGVSPFRDFLLLSPASADSDPTPTGHDGTIALSKQSIGGSHPAVWSIDPPVATEPLFSVHTTDLGHSALIVEVPVSRGAASAGALRFGIVLIGKIEA